MKYNDIRNQKKYLEKKLNSLAHEMKKLVLAGESLHHARPTVLAENGVTASVVILGSLLIKISYSVVITFFALLF